MTIRAVAPPPLIGVLPRGLRGTPGQPGGNSYPTTAMAAADTVASTITALVTYGRSVMGDHPPAVWQRRSAAPSHPGYFVDTSGAFFELMSAPGRPEMLGAAGDGATDDTTPLLNIDAYAQARGCDVEVAKVHAHGSNLAFGSHVRFTSRGRLKPAAGKTVAFALGFTAGVHQFILDVSAAGSGITGRVVAREVTPQMFGAVGNSPSTDDAPAIARAWAAHVASGLPLQLTPTRFTAKSQLVLDWGARWGVGTQMFGTGVMSHIAFDAGVASPNLKHTSTGYSSGGQRPTFYGEHRNFQVSGATAAGGVVLQYGEGDVLSSGNTSVYFNGLEIKGVVVKNNAAGVIGALLSGMTDCDWFITANAGGVAYDGSVALQLQHSCFCRIAGSSGNAETGILLAAGSLYANQFDSFDLEVLKVGFKIRAQYAANSVYRGTFASMDYCVDSTANSGGMVFEGNQFGGIGVSYVRNYAATDGTFGGYGVIFRAPQQKLIGAPNPQTAPAPPTSLTSNTWVRNVWCQDAFVSLFLANSDGVVDIRDWYDAVSSGGARRVNNGGSTNYLVLVKAGESIRVQSSGVINCTWYPVS